jgi:hypothetical protein
MTYFRKSQCGNLATESAAPSGMRPNLRIVRSGRFPETLGLTRFGLISRSVIWRSAHFRSQIAWLLGFQEVSAFAHPFKRRTGTTPTEARASIRRSHGISQRRIT